MGQAFCGERGSVDIDDTPEKSDEIEKETEVVTRSNVVSAEEAETALARTSLRTPSLTEGDKRVLRATWRVLDLDRTAVGTQFVLMLFRTYPDYLSLFQALAALDEDALGGSSALHAHAMIFMSSIAGIVESLDDPPCLVSILKKIADRHKSFGLTEGDFRKATAVFLKVLKTVEGLEGLEYDRKTILAAWQKALAIIVVIIGQSLPSGEPGADDED